MSVRFPRLLFAIAVAGAAISAPAHAEDSEDTVPDAAADDPVEAITSSLTAEQKMEIDTLEPGVPSQVIASSTGAPPPGRVMDELDLGATEVTGNQELPKVLYIVPWRKSDPGDLMGRPANTLLDEVLEPVDRREFVREVDYYDDLFEEDGG